jgi:hypothetical protein
MAQYPFRPIVSGRDSITAPISKHLAHILTPITIKTPHQVQDSLHLKDQLTNFTISDTHVLVSFDISNMYPSIPHAPAIAAIRRLLQQDPTLKSRTTMSIDHIISLLEAILQLAHYQWLGVYYAQTECCAIGDSTSTPLSNTYMTEFKTDVLATYHSRHDPPTNPPTAMAPTGTPPADQPTNLPSVILFWFRQADDTMTAIHRDHVASFLEFLNSMHPNIKWTFEREEDGRINMLDLTILRQPDGTMQFDVYRKPTHTDQYIPWDSDQPLNHKGSTILSLTRRAHLLPSGLAPKQLNSRRCTGP